MPRILFLADTHLGFDFPLRPRVNRRRRGDDFFANFRTALAPALRGEVDLVLHGGDLFNRSNVPAGLVQMAFEPMIEVAEYGVPVVLVPGNHERSRIPLQLWGAHPNIHLLDEPKTIRCTLGNDIVALAGFPFVRHIREHFIHLVERTRWHDASSDVRLLCMHQTVEGAQVGPAAYTFRRGVDIIPGQALPADFAVVASGHIHRSQILRHDLRGRPLPAPVVYPGSIERASFAERDEAKHYCILEFDGEGELSNVKYVPLPARPMASLTLSPDGTSPQRLDRELRARLAGLDPESVVQIRLEGDLPAGAEDVLTAAHLRSIAPATMNISLSMRRRAGQAMRRGKRR